MHGRNQNCDKAHLQIVHCTLDVDDGTASFICYADIIDDKRVDSDLKGYGRFNGTSGSR